VELNGLLPVLKRWILVIAIATGVAVLIGWRFSASAEESYEATAVILVGPLNTDNDTMRASGALAQTYAELATSESLLDRVSDETGVPAADLEEGVRSTANGTTRFLTIRARAEEADTARAVADAVTVDLIRQSREGAVRPEGQLRLIDPAVAPDKPVTPRGDLVIPLAAVAGLLGSAALVLLYEFVSDSAETASKVGEATGIPTLVVGRRRQWGDSRSRRRPDPLRVVATQVELASPSMRAVTVTGASDGDGSAGVAQALARIWSERRPVVVLDVTGDVVRTGDGAPLPDAPRCAAITEQAARALLDELTADGSLVVVIGPSVVSSTAGLVWSHVADVTLLGVRRFQTQQSQVRNAASNLRATGAEVPFVLLHDGHVRVEPHPHRARRPRPGPDAGPPTSGSGRPSSEGTSAPDDAPGAPTRPTAPTGPTGDDSSPRPDGRAQASAPNGTGRTSGPKGARSKARSKGAGRTAADGATTDRSARPTSNRSTGTNGGGRPTSGDEPDVAPVGRG
jgi:capsular polysaccharide biosynthesis protein